MFQFARCIPLLAAAASRPCTGWRLRPAVRNLIWKVGFERDADDGDEVEQDMLFRLMTGNVDGKTCMLSCGFL